MGAGGHQPVKEIGQKITAFAILADHQIMGLGSGFQLVQCHFDSILSFVVSGCGRFDARGLF